MALHTRYPSRSQSLLLGAGLAVLGLAGRKLMVQAPTTLAGDWDKALTAEHKAALALFDGLAAAERLDKQRNNKISFCLQRAWVAQRDFRSVVRLVPDVPGEYTAILRESSHYPTDMFLQPGMFFGVLTRKCRATEPSRYCERCREARAEGQARARDASMSRTARASCECRDCPPRSGTYGAHGFFELTESLADVTRADVFQRVGERVPAFVRFSTVVGSKGSFDLARDVRGFAVKLYTNEGNWDLVGNNIPVFFIQDPIKFSDLVHAAKPEPDRMFPQAQTAHDNFWDFISLTPESMHMVMWIMSDRAIPRSYRFMEGFGVHTFRLLDAEGNSTFVKFHWKPQLRLQSVVWNEAVKINGADPDFHRRDLWEAIEGGDFPAWDLGVQLFNQEFADQFDFDVLDPTKIIPEEILPIHRIGRLVLDRVIDNFFAETEQVAFCTQNVPPGIDFSNDPLLQGRNFSYLDTQLKRLGSPNFTHLPINAPRCPMAHFQQDGHMAMRNPKGRVNYEPNSWGPKMGGPREDPVRGFRSFAETNPGAKQRLRPESFADHYSQARQFYISQTPIEQKHIGDALVFELSKVERPDIRLRMVSHLRNVDADLAQTVASGLGATLPEQAQAAMPTRQDLEPSPALSIVANGPNGFAGRKLGILVTDGTNAELFDALTEGVTAAGAVYDVVAPMIGGVTLSDGSALAAKQKIDGGPSVLFDAVAVIPSIEGAQLLLGDGPSRDFVSDAFVHCKFIGLSEGGVAMMSAAGLGDKLDEACRNLASASDAAAFVAACGPLRYWQRELKVDMDARNA